MKDYEPYRHQTSTVPSLVSVNSSRNIKVTVLNNGAKTATDYSVDLYRDGKLWKSLDGEALEFAKEKTYLFAIEPDITESGNNHTYYAVVDFAYDEKHCRQHQRHKNIDRTRQQSTRTERPYRHRLDRRRRAHMERPRRPRRGRNYRRLRSIRALYNQPHGRMDSHRQRRQSHIHYQQQRQHIGRL